jgi:hypothetical protein
MREIAHPSVDERKARGWRTGSDGCVESYEVTPGHGPLGPGRHAGGAEPQSRAGPGAGPSWPDLSNFGAFASPERILLFDLNDFDETLPGPFDYDVRRMAASFTIAGRNNGFSKADTRAATLASVAAYRETMAEFAQMQTWTFGLPASTKTSSSAPSPVW